MVALRVVHLEQRRAVTHERRVNVAPLAPLIGIDWEKRFGALLRAQCSEKCFRSFADRLRRDAGLFNAEQAGNDRSIGRDALERLGRGGERFLHIVRSSALGVERPIGTALGAGFRRTACAWIAVTHGQDPPCLSGSTRVVCYCDRRRSLPPKFSLSPPRDCVAM